MNSKISSHVLEILEWPLVKKELLSRCSTSPGKGVVEELQPIPREAVISRMEKISDLKDIKIQGDSINFAGITEIGPLVERSEKGAILKLEELTQVRNFIISSARIKEFLKNFREEYPSLKDEYSRMEDLKEIGKELIPSITENGELSSEKFPELKKLKKNIFATRQELEKTVSKLVHAPSMENIVQEKTYTTLNQRFVILIKSNMKGRLKGTVQDISSRGATLYFEPDEIKALNNKFIMLDLELQNEITRILKTLSGHVGQYSAEIFTNLEIIAYLDFLSASAKFSTSIDGNAPLIEEEPLIELYGAKHPLLYLMQPDTTISNDIEMGTDFNCLIISGANTGGKTVLMKTLGLCVLLTMLGLHIPAKADSKIGIFSGILADIGDDQSLEQSLSTYSGQIVMINEMLKNAKNDTLVLIDEIIVGTNPRQGAALAQAILEEMANTGSRIIVTTHYSELKELASENKRFQNASVSFDMETLKPTYKLTIGLPGVSYAIEIARNYGLSENVLERSKELFDQRDISVEALLEETQKYRQEVEDERQKLAQLKEEYISEKERFIRKQKKLNQLTEEVKKGHGIAFLEELEKYRKEVSDRITDLQQSDLKKTGEIQKDIIERQKNISAKLEKDRKDQLTDEYSPIDPSKLSIGDRVFVASLEKVGTVEDIDISGNSAQILFGGTIKSRFKMNDLLKPGQGSFSSSPMKQKRKKKKEYNEYQGGAISHTIQTSYNTIDLRGKRVEEAIHFMEQELDSMQRSNTGMAIVIHGHGTGALKEAVRENLKISIYTADYRAGDLGEGGDGVTVVRLRS